MAASNWRTPLLSLLLLIFSAAAANAQGLLPVPSRVTPELGAYYINKLGASLRYYALLTQRNNVGSNAYAIVNAIAPDDDPISAARRVAPLRGYYSQNGIGGKVTVEGFYKLFRCQDESCAVISRIVVSGVTAGRPGPADALTAVKGTIGSSSWTINANQAAVNGLLAAAEERAYKDSTYSTELFYKVTTNPRACNAVYPETAWASIGEFSDIPQFGCVTGQGATFMLATNTPKGIEQMIQDIVPPERCDGSLGVILGTSGPSIVKVVEEPGSVATVVVITLPSISAGPCFRLYDTTERLFALTAVVGQTSFFEATRDTDQELVTAAGAQLGFNGSCEFTGFQNLYGPFVTGQSNAIIDSTNNRTFLNLLMEFNSSQLCMALSGDSFGPGGRDTTEDACAEIFFGDPSQQREAVISANFLPASTDAAITTFLLPNTTAGCYKDYALSVRNILPQLAIDFEATKNFLIGSTEVKTHLDSVAANAASILAVEVALASAGIIVAQTIGRLGVYRRRQISSPIARAAALILTALGITLFNIPNFALISRSLRSQRTEKSYTQVGLQSYAPGNFSTIVYAESYHFVTVQVSLPFYENRLSYYCWLKLDSPTLGYVLPVCGGPGQCYRSFFSWQNHLHVLQVNLIV